jgi:hypothetical protein
MSARTVCLLWVALASVSALTAQTNGTWEKVFLELNAQDFSNANGYANVGFAPAIMSVPGKPFTATRTYKDQRKESGENVGDPLTAEWTIARDEKGRIHYEMAFESAQKGKLVIGGFDIQIYDPVAHTLTRYFASPDHSLPSEPIAKVRKLQLMSKLVEPIPSQPPKQQPGEDSSNSDKPESSIPVAKPPAKSVIKFVPTKDDLPLQSVDGLTVVGHRTILKYGAKQQFFQIQENWLSPEYAVDMRQVVLRETMGEETVETREFVPGPPDPVLFQIPSGYVTQIER